MPVVLHVGMIAYNVLRRTTLIHVLAAFMIL